MTCSLRQMVAFIFVLSNRENNENYHRGFHHPFWWVGEGDGALLPHSSMHGATRICLLREAICRDLGGDPRNVSQVQRWSVRSSRVGCGSPGNCGRTTSHRQIDVHFVAKPRVQQKETNRIVRQGARYYPNSSAAVFAIKTRPSEPRRKRNKCNDQPFARPERGLWISCRISRATAAILYSRATLKLIGWSQWLPNGADSMPRRRFPRERPRPIL